MALTMTGSITLNGVSDAEMAKVFELKAKHGPALLFNPQHVQPIVNSNPPAYNNVQFSWSTADGFHLVHEVVSALAKKEAAGQ